MGGCGTVFAVLLLVGLAVEYWYISAGIAVLAIGGAIYWFGVREQPAQLDAKQPVSTVSSTASKGQQPRETTRTCGNCGATGIGSLYCPQCGEAQALTCAGCGTTGLTSAFCPECGSATYKQPRA